MKDFLTVGVIGSGHISDIYLQNMKGLFKNLKVKGIASSHFEHAQAKAEKYGLMAYSSVSDLLSDPEIEMVVVLTPAPTHAPLIRQALCAGKHVYTEKVLALEPEEAKELVDLADEKNLMLGSAPDTFLGGALTTARRLLDEGAVGTVTSFQVMTNRNLDLLSSLFTFLRLPGGGICPDYGVYYLTALVTLLGPMERVHAIFKNPKPVRVNCFPGHPEFGKEYSYPNESQIFALMETKSGITGTFAVNGECIAAEIPDFKILGTKGILELTDANTFGGTLKLTTMDEGWSSKTELIEPSFPFTENSRGVGPSEMADAILHNRKNRASGQMAYHVLDIIHALEESSKKEGFVSIPSTCQRPELFENGKDLI